MSLYGHHLTLQAHRGLLKLQRLAMEKHFSLLMRNVGEREKGFDIR